MGCCHTKDFRIDETFTASLTPTEARDFIADRSNWPHILPGATDSSPHLTANPSQDLDDNHPPGWEESIDDASGYPIYTNTKTGEQKRANPTCPDWDMTVDNLVYSFTQIRKEDVGDPALLYNVMVEGKASGLPIKFGFQVTYGFTTLVDDPYFGIPQERWHRKKKIEVVVPGEEVGTLVSRVVDQLTVYSCNCLLGSTVRKNLRRGVLKENEAMASLMTHK